MTPIYRTVAYTYDGVQRLTGAAESPGSSFTYSYNLAGNRTGVTVDGTAVLTDTYDAADQVVGWTYDAAGNLTNDGVTSYGYDATNDLTGTTTTGQSRAYSYNGDGTLVGQTANGTTTSYTQDLAGNLTQVLASTVGITTTDYLYGQDIAPLAGLNGTTRTWYGIDGQGSVRQSLDDSGTVLGVQSYDPFGQIEAGASLIGPFGYTGELQDSTTGQEYLRARWYQPGSGTLLGVDPALSLTGQPYSYAYDDPVNGSDPSGLDCGFLTFLQGNCRLPTPQEAAATWQQEVRPETYSAAVAVAGFYDSATNGAFSLITGLAGVNIPQDCQASYAEGEDFGLAYNVIQSLLTGGTDEAADASLAAKLPRLLGVVEGAGQDAERLALEAKLAELSDLDVTGAYQDALAKIQDDMALLDGNPTKEEFDAYVLDINTRLEELRPNIKAASARPEIPAEVTVAEVAGGDVIAPDLLQELRETYKSNPALLKQFENALEKGVVGPEGENGIKMLRGSPGGYQYELKILSSGDRLLGNLETIAGKSRIVFTKWKKAGLHK